MHSFHDYDEINACIFVTKKHVPKTFGNIRIGMLQYAKCKLHYNMQSTMKVCWIGMLSLINV